MSERRSGRGGPAQRAAREVVRQRHQRGPRAERRVARDRHRRDGRDRRRVRVRQEHAAAPARRPRHADVGQRRDRRPRLLVAVRGRARRGPQPAARLRVPVPSPAAGVQRARQRRDAAADPPDVDDATRGPTRRRCSNASASRTACITGPANCRAASASARRSRGRWSRGPRACSPTSRPATSTAVPRPRCSR